MSSEYVRQLTVKMHFQRFIDALITPDIRNHFASVPSEQEMMANIQKVLENTTSQTLFM